MEPSNSRPGEKKKRKLRIPTVVDTWVCQAILQVLQQTFDPKFSHHSYGFRPRKSAHQAINQARQYVKQGYRFVVDIDLENFFSQVNHDKLMSEITKTIKDVKVLKLLRKLLNTGVLSNGLVKASDKGTPQGNLLSPFLSNIMLDLLDKELEKRNHKFCRYTDDCNIYVNSRRAGKRVRTSLTNFIEKQLKLRVNRDKSAIGKVSRRNFLGFTFIRSKDNPKIKVSPQVINRFKDVIRALTRAGKWNSTENVVQRLVKYSERWLAYFGQSQTPTVLSSLAGWLRRKLRCMYWRQWKTAKNRYKQLRKLGIQHELAAITVGSGKKQWRMSTSRSVQTALPNSYFHKLGLPKFTCQTR